MIIVLQIAGIAAVLAGLAAIGFGVPVKEFSFGNTLIMSGTIGLCTGMLLLGLSVVAMELKGLARRMAAGPRQAAEPRARAALPPLPVAAGAAAGEGSGTFSRDQQAPVEPSIAPPVSPVPWHEDPRTRQEPMASEPVPAAAVPPRPRPKRNLLFASTVRKDRQPAGASDPAAGDPRTQPPATAGGAPPASFEDAWPRADRGRPGEVPKPGEVPPQRRSSRPAQSEPSAAAERPASPPGQPEEQPAVTVLKSGVVDGMAYSLYSDGSIEAQMPEGMMRFASIDELRAHLNKRP
ncbi:MAG TPA: DUF308 domain-containing protein [Bradyrhizobium sp.]|uniref:DUF308 domain-containing protein n=1 Tax=Bradyrhizobium sp. TaxID=376 RepID=UPI002D1C55B7|nr:DUF308 domain-containing protein [Bradyrhizobium sp.]HLZ05558.1 DUF308 domain-containing protein [Bradyrhizobium sp.]